MRLWIVVLFLLSACPVPRGGPDASTSPDPVTAYCDARAAAVCAWEQRCGRSSQSACPAVLADCAAQLRPLLRAGALSFDADAGAACAAAFAAEPCDFATPVDTPARCAEVFVGTGQEGDSCGTCAAGLGCVYTSTSCGRCVVRDPPPALPGLGEMCISPAVDGAGCARGLACALTSGSRGVCEPFARAGEACQGRSCAMGLVCRAADGGSSCQPRSELGEGCAQRLDCKAGLRCVSGTCAALLAQGDSCATWEDCASSRCVGGTCASSFVGLGDSCTDALCRPELACSADRVCVIPLPPLASCGDQICEAGLSCEQGVCTSRALTCR